MIKLRDIFVVLILILIPNVVFADDIDHSHIYLIEDFKVNGSEITIDGYSFISHQDNSGYGNPNGVGNLKTYIVAYTGNWKDGYKYHDTCNNSENNSKCYSVRMPAYNNSTVPGSNNRDFWYARCSDDACKDTIIKTSSFNRIKSGNFINDSKCTSISSSGLTTSSACLYSNVGFKGKIDLLKIYKRFSKSSNFSNNIEFKIVSTIDGVKSNEDGKSVVVSDLAVNTQICTIGQKQCESGKLFKSGDFEFIINDLSDTVYYDATIAVPRKSDGSRYPSSEMPGYFKEKETYPILKINTRQTLSKAINGVTYGYYTDSFIQLDSKVSNFNYIYNGWDTGYKTIVPDNDGSDTEGINNDFYTNSNFVVFNGSLKISNFKINVEELSCNDVGFGSNNVVAEVNCNESGNFNQCGSSSVNNVIYVRSNSTCSALKTYINGNYYIPVEVKADILYNQSATFKFGNIIYDDVGYVRAGKGFGLGTTMYTNIVTWMNAKRLDGKPYYYYEYENYIESGGSCVLDVSFDITEAEKYYFYDLNNDWKWVVSLEDATFAVIDKMARKAINTNVIDDIEFISCDSNGGNRAGCAINPTNSVAGSWTEKDETSIEQFKYNGVRFGNVITNNYEFNLSNSYVQVIGDEAGKALYGLEAEGKISELVSTGKKFYVDFKWVYEDDWPFNLAKDINPSFIDTMNWKLNGTCGVKVKDGYYTSAGSGSGDGLSFTYKYRSILLENPFPKSDTIGIAVNWNEWYNSFNNKSRIKNTYMNGVKYKILISKINNSGTIKISDINAMGGNYVDLINFNKDGTSNFVENTFLIKQGVGVSYCGLGYFSTSCDK